MVDRQVGRWLDRLVQLGRNAGKYWSVLVFFGLFLIT
jgi:hypothetical protein